MNKNNINNSLTIKTVDNKEDYITDYIMNKDTPINNVIRIITNEAVRIKKLKEQQLAGKAIRLNTKLDFHTSTMIGLTTTKGDTGYRR